MKQIGIVLCFVAGFTAPIQLDAWVALVLAYIGGILIGRVIKSQGVA